MPTATRSSLRVPHHRELRRSLQRLYARDARRENIHPDPLSFVYHYDAPLDREVSALVASSLAYGRVTQIAVSVADVLARLGPSPSRLVRSSSRADLGRKLRGFRHRFTGARDVADLLHGAAVAIEAHGSLGACFAAGYSGADETILPAAAAFVSVLAPRRRPGTFPLLPSPDAGSATKRLHLFLRWMIRRDAVDPGTFAMDAAHQLVVPIDTHMHRVGRTLGFTARKSADLAAALEITRAFRAITPADPARYDFVLARLGMAGELEALLAPHATGGRNGRSEPRRSARRET